MQGGGGKAVNDRLRAVSCREVEGRQWKRDQELCHPVWRKEESRRA